MVQPADPGDVPTQLDEGREHRDTPTFLDDGRGPHRATEEDIDTELDEGRRRPDDPWRAGLPPNLAARFELAQERPVHSGAEADLYLVRELGEPGRSLVLKAYRSDREPDERVWAALRPRTSQHVFELVESGRAASRAYEIQENLTGGDLAALRRRHPAGLDEKTLTTIADHVAMGLNALHGRDVVHRDIKPANLMLRQGPGLDVVIVDTGIATVIDDEPQPSRPATIRYAPPEWDSGYADPPTDWWALGITLIELATGQPAFEGLSDERVRRHVTTRPVDLSVVRHPRVRQLCQGLLTRDPAQRWGSDNVHAWARGRDADPPPLTEVTSPEAPAVRPYSFRGELCHSPQHLAAVLANAWAAAAAGFFGNDRHNIDPLAQWLEGLPASARGGVARPDVVRGLASAKGPPDVLLLRLLHELDPGRQPSYRHELITRPRLPALAQVAMREGGIERAVITDLWRQDLLPVLATAGSEGEFGAGLDTADVDWRARHREWHRAVAAIRNAEAREDLYSLPEEVVLAACLYAATMSAPDRDNLELDLQQVARGLPEPLPWFEELTATGRQRLALVMAHLLRRTAEREALDEHVRRERVLATHEWERRNQGLARWSRRQSRVVALGWAVAGAALVGALWMLLIGVSDSARVASDAAITDGWIGSVLSIGAVLATEAVLATLIGARYPLRYSVPAAGLIALRPVAARVRGHGVVALFVLLGVAAAVGIVTVSVPQLLPAATALAVIGWAVGRYRAWHREVRQERQEARASVAEQRDRRARATGEQPEEGEPT